jgi:hypothetical protein
VLFVTLEKSEDDYSPTTMYRDYALSPRQFHWQSQSGTAPDDVKGRRHTQHREDGVEPLLFVRRTKKDDRNETVPYVFAGPAELAEWTGERPMTIVWNLVHEMPAWLFSRCKVTA